MNLGVIFEYDAELHVPSIRRSRCVLAGLAVKPDLAEATQALAQVSKAPAKVEEIRKTVRKESVPGPRLLKSR